MRVTGTIEILGGGAVAVDTDTLRAAAARLIGARSELEQIAGRIDHAKHLLFAERGLADGAVGAASLLFARVAEAMADAAALADQLRRAAALYELVELDAELAAAQAAGDAKEIARIGARRRWLEGEYAGIGAESALLEIERAVLWPGDIVRLATEQGLDLGGLLDLGGGVGGVLGRIFGQPAGIIGGVVLGGGAIAGAALAGGTRWGLIARHDRLRPASGGVRLERLEGPRAPVRAPSGLAGAGSRIPADERTRVRVERYAMPGGSAQYAVYIAGTRSTAFGGAEAWDMTSNADLATGQMSTSYQATIAALDAAGARPGDVVHAFGHSQGAMIASHLAVEGAYETRTLVSFGSPVEADVGPGTLSVGVRHTEDPIAMMAGGGHMGPVGAPGSFVVESAPAAAPDDGTARQPHAMGGYVQTAAAVDASRDPRVDALRGVFGELATAESVEVFEFGATRVDAVSPSSGGGGSVRRPS